MALGPLRSNDEALLFVTPNDTIDFVHDKSFPEREGSNVETFAS
jgi:hypothetical protein